MSQGPAGQLMTPGALGVAVTSTRKMSKSVTSNARFISGLNGRASESVGASQEENSFDVLAEHTGLGISAA
jgi:hypothetical protein